MTIRMPGRKRGWILGPWGGFRGMAAHQSRPLTPTYLSFARSASETDLPGNSNTGAPPLDLYDNGDSFVVVAELPGVQVSELDVSASEDSLTIKGHRSTTNEVRGRRHYRCECSYGSFSRSVTFPTPIDPDSVEASYRDGILEVILKKMSQEPSRRKVPVSSD